MNFIVFSDDWGRHPSSCQHLFRHVVRQHTVCWVNTIGMRRPRLCRRDLRRAMEKVAAWRRRSDAAVQPPSGMQVLNPWMVPYEFIPAVRRFNRGQVIRSVHKALTSQHDPPRVLVTTVPNVAECVGHLGEDLSVYYCVDDFTRWPGLEHRLLLQMEAELLKRVDMVVATSHSLLDTRQCATGVSHHLPHGVDLDHMGQVREGTVAEHERIAHIPHPRLGFFGLVDERLDQALIERVAIERPQWHWVLVGRQAVDLDRVGRLPNVHTHGPVPYAEIPNVAAGFDVCVLPYVCSGMTECINPLKLKEYLATGRPVVASALPEALRLDQVVRIARTGNDWVTVVEQALQRPPGPDEMAARSDLLRHEGWDTKADLLLGWIGQALTSHSLKASAR